MSSPPVAHSFSGPPTLAQLPVDAVAAALRLRGLWLDVGLVTVRVRSDSKVLARQLHTVYGAFPFVDDAPWADVHLRVDRALGLRRWLRPQVFLRSEGQQPFEPFGADSPLPMLEWGCNWLIAERQHRMLLLHAGVVERDGLALVMPATPGSGKSTLTAALMHSGWRLLSDEFGALDPATLQFQPVLKPVALKNQSIEAIAQLAPSAVLGPRFPNTRKGLVVHAAPPADAVRARHVTARPGAVVLPKWEAGSPTRFEPLPASEMFSAVAFNAFNYTTVGEPAFDAALALTRRCPAWRLVYSDLHDALRTLDAAWPGVAAHHARCGDRG